MRILPCTGTHALPCTGTHVLSRTGTHALSCTHAPSLIVIVAVGEAQRLCAACFLATLRHSDKLLLRSSTENKVRQ